MTIEFVVDHRINTWTLYENGVPCQQRAINPRTWEHLVGILERRGVAVIVIGKPRRPKKAKPIRQKGGKSPGGKPKPVPPSQDARYLNLCALRDGSVWGLSASSLRVLAALEFIVAPDDPTITPLGHRFLAERFEDRELVK